MTFRVKLKLKIQTQQLQL